MRNDVCVNQKRYTFLKQQFNLTFLLQIRPKIEMISFLREIESISSTQQEIYNNLRTKFNLFKEEQESGI